MKIVTDELNMKLVREYYNLQKHDDEDCVLIPKTRSGGLDILDELFKIRLALAIKRPTMKEESHGNLHTVLTMIETDVRTWLENSISA